MPTVAQIQPPMPDPARRPLQPYVTSSVSRGAWEAGQVPSSHPMYRQLREQWGAPGRAGGVEQMQEVSERGMGGSPDFSGIIAQMQAQQTAARQANIRRYGQGLRILRAGYGAATRQARRFGGTALRDIQESAVRQRATGEQELISRGLGGTTIRGAMTRGVERERLRGRARIGEQRSMLLGQIAQQRARDIAGFIERRTDVGPDLGMFASLLQAAGQGQRR